MNNVIDSFNHESVVKAIEFLFITIGDSWNFYLPQNSRLFLAFGSVTSNALLINIIVIIQLSYDLSNSFNIDLSEKQAIRDKKTILCLTIRMKRNNEINGKNQKKGIRVFNQGKP